jgi:Uma2 family endonuclease
MFAGMMAHARETSIGRTPGMRMARLGVRPGENTGFAAEDSEAVPDIAVRQFSILPSADWADVAVPLLVVEVTSRSTKRHDEIKKRPYYLENSIPEYWVVDGEARTVRVRTPTGERIESGVLRWHPTGASSPLEIGLIDFFERNLGPRTG